MIAKKGSAISVDDEPFITAMSKVDKKKQLSQASSGSGEELTNSDNSVGQEHDRHLSSGMNLYQNDQRISSAPMARSSATESLKLDSQSQSSKLKIFDLPLSQKMLRQQRNPPKTSKGGMKSPNLKQYTPFMSIVQQKRLGASSVGNSQNNYKQAIHSMKNYAPNRQKRDLPPEYQQNSKQVYNKPNKAPLKP